jgi:uncharacterized membrane protein YjfL (UPF0719 family)
MNVQDTINVVYWDSSYNTVLVLNLLIAIALFASLRLFSGVIAHVSSSVELTKKDNPAFGVSMAGAALGIAIVTTGALYGEPIHSLYDSAISVGLYGLMGIVLMALARIIFDKVALPNISLRDEIVKGNVAVGIADAGNVIATALIIRAVMTWVEANTIEGLAAVIIAYLVSQVILTASTLLRVKTFSKQEDGCAQTSLKEGNIALALRFAGRKIEAAFAITAASNLLVYEIYDIPMLLTAWAVLSVLIIVLLWGLSFVATKIILSGIDVEDEVVRQRNIALGVVQGVIYISLGLLVAELTV